MSNRISLTSNKYIYEILNIRDKENQLVYIYIYVCVCVGLLSFILSFQIGTCVWMNNTNIQSLLLVECMYVCMYVFFEMKQNKRKEKQNQEIQL